MIWTYDIQLWIGRNTCIYLQHLNMLDLPFLCELTRVWFSSTILINWYWYSGSGSEWFALQSCYLKLHTEWNSDGLAWKLSQKGHSFPKLLSCCCSSCSFLWQVGNIAIDPISQNGIKTNLISKVVSTNASTAIGSKAVPSVLDLICDQWWTFPLRFSFVKKRVDMESFFSMSMICGICRFAKTIWCDDVDKGCQSDDIVYIYMYIVNVFQVLVFWLHRYDKYPCTRWTSDNSSHIFQRTSFVCIPKFSCIPG